MNFTRQFAPLRATLIPSARPDRIPTGYKAGHHMNSCRALTRSAPVPRPPRPRCAKSAISFCRKSKAAHEFTRQFAPLRAILILSARPDRIPTGYRAGHHMNSCRALTRSAPVPRPPRHAAPIRKSFCRKSKAAHEFTRQFATLRATLILSARPDRIQSRASHEFMQRFAPLCANAPPARRRRRPSPSLPSPVMHREFSCPISPNLSCQRSCLSTHPTAPKKPLI